MLCIARDYVLMANGGTSQGGESFSVWLKASIMSITWPCFRRRRSVDHDFLPLARFIEHTQHANAILVSVTLRIELFGRESVNGPMPSSSFFRYVHLLTLRDLLKIPDLVRVVNRALHNGLLLDFSRWGP